jgi:hypothetical protein
MARVATQPRFLFASCAALAAPWRWLIGTRGRRRAVAVLFGLLVPVFAFWYWQEGQLLGLPDVGDPFDVRSAGIVYLPDADNAFVEYKEATHRFVRPGWTSWWETNWDCAWSQVNPTIRAWMEQNREALEVWRQGTEKPDALYIQPGDMNFATLLPVTQELRNFAHMAAWRGSECEEKEDMDGAWSWYRAILRSSRHSGRHGCLIERIVGAALHETARKRIEHWAADPRTSALLLRRALDETIAIDAGTVPISDPLKEDYLVLLRAVDDANSMQFMKDFGYELPAPVSWLYHDSVYTRVDIYSYVLDLRCLVRNDRERSRRVVRLIFANWLAQCDRPLRLRPKLVSFGQRAPSVFAPDPTAPASTRALTPEALARWYDSTIRAEMLLRPHRSRSTAHIFECVSTERVKQARLIITLASQLYLRERGRLPESPEEVVGAYLKELPEGYEPEPAFRATSSSDRAPGSRGKPTP